MTEKIFIACDHGGLELKKSLKSLLESQNIQVEDLGTNSTESVDYPALAHNLCKKIVATDDTIGILICGTGIGMSIAANKNKGIRAALCSESYSAKMARLHNDANVLCLGGRVVGANLALDIVTAFLKTSFEGGRHQRRVDMLDPDQL